MLIQEDDDAITPSINECLDEECSKHSQHRVSGKVTTLMKDCDVMRREERRYQDIREGGNMLKMLQLSLYGSSDNERSDCGDARTRCHNTSTTDGCGDRNSLHERNDTIELDSGKNYCNSSEEEDYCMDTFIRKSTLPLRRSDSAHKRTFLPLPKDASKFIDSSTMSKLSKFCKHCPNCSKSHDCVGACYYFEGRVGTRNQASDSATFSVMNFDLFCENCKEWARANPEVCHQLGFFCESRQGCEVCCPVASNNGHDTVDGACTETVSSSDLNTSTTNESGSHKKNQGKFPDNELVSNGPLQEIAAVRQVDECNRITLMGDIIADGGLCLRGTDSEDEEQGLATVVSDSVGSSAASSECSSLLSWRGGSGHSSAVDECPSVATTSARSTQSAQREREMASKFDVRKEDSVESKSSKHGSEYCSGASQIPDDNQSAFTESPNAVKSFGNSNANGDIALAETQEGVFMSANVDLRMLTQDNMHHCVEKCSAVAERRSVAPAKPPRKHSTHQRSLFEENTNTIVSGSTPPPTRPKSSAGEHILNGSSNTAPKESAPESDDRSLMMKCREVTVQAVVHSLPGSRRNSFSRRGYKLPAASSPILRVAPPLSNLFRMVERENRYFTSKNPVESQHLLNPTETSPRESSFPLGFESASVKPESSVQEASLCASFAQDNVMKTQPSEKRTIPKANHCGQVALDVTEFGCFGVLVGAEGINVCDARTVETHLHSNSTTTHYTNGESQKENIAYLDDISIVSCDGNEDSRKTSTLKKHTKLSAKKSSRSVLAAIANLTGRTSSSSKNKSIKSSVSNHQESPQVSVKLSRSNSMPTTPQFLNRNSVVISPPRNSVSSANTSATSDSIPKSLLVHQALHDGLARSSTMRETTPPSLQTIKEAMVSLSLEAGFDPRTSYHARSLTTASEVTTEHSTSNLETSVGFETSLTSSSAVPQSSLTSSSARVTRSAVIPTSPSLKPSKKRKKKSNRKNCVRMLDVSNTSEDSSYYRRPSSIPVASASSGLPTATSISTPSAAKPAAAVSYYYSPAHYYPMPNESPTLTGRPLIPYHNLVNSAASNNFLRADGFPVNTSVVPGLSTNTSASIPSRIPTSINGFSTKLPPNAVLESTLNRYKDIHSAALLNATNINTGAALANNMAAPAEHLPNGSFNDSAHQSNVPYYANNSFTDTNSGKLDNNNCNRNVQPLESHQQYQALLPGAQSTSPNLDFHPNFQMNTSGLLITPSSYLSLTMAPISTPNTREDTATTFPFPCLPHTKYGRSNPSQDPRSVALHPNPEALICNQLNNSMVSHQSFSSLGGGRVGRGDCVNPVSPLHRNQSLLEPITPSNSYYLPSNNEDLAASGLKMNDNNRPNSRSIATSLSVKAVPIVSSYSKSLVNVHNSHFVGSTTVETTLGNSFAPHRSRDVIVSSCSSIHQRSDSASERAADTVPTVTGSQKSYNSVPVPNLLARLAEQQRVSITSRNTGGLQDHVEVTASSESNSGVMRSSVTVTQV